MLVKFYIIIIYLFVCEQILNFIMQNVDWLRERITSPNFSVALNGSLVGYFKGREGFFFVDK